MKLQPTLVITQAQPSWFVRLAFENFSWDAAFEAIRARIKQLPGRVYEASQKTWLLPIECVSLVAQVAIENGYKVERKCS